jgi:hypothetical protein
MWWLISFQIGSGRVKLLDEMKFEDYSGVSSK